MVRGVLGMCWMLAAAGCFALNSGYEGSGGAGSESSDTEATAGESSASASEGGSAVTTVTAGDASTGGGSPTDSAGTSPTGQPGNSSGGGETGSADTGPVGCKPTGGGEVEEDAFLANCQPGLCGQRNFGEAEIFRIVEAMGEQTIFLLRVPNAKVEAHSVEITLTVRAQGAAADNGFPISATAIVPPCEWVQGPHPGELLVGGESGVTFDRCNGDPNGGSLWGSEDATVRDHIDTNWTTADEIVLAKDFTKGAPFDVKLTLTRNSLGEGPHTILISSSVETLDDLVVYTSESVFRPTVDIYADCP